MKYIVATLLLVLPLACCETVAAAEDAVTRTPPELIVDVDVNDCVRQRNHKMTEGDVKTLVAQLKRNGCQTLIIRCGYLGYLPYRTALSYPVGFDAEQARANRAPTDVISDVEAYIKQHTAWNKRYAEVIRDFNPPAAFIRAGHEHGMKVLMWLDIFDDWFPGYRSKFLDEHPYCQWVGKDGKTYFKGLMDYSWPEARAFRVAQAGELLDLGADGIHCSTSAHERHMPNTHEEDFYGYSQPVVAAFQAKYGVDIRTAKDFDKAAWHDLKGDAMVQLYRDLGKLCHDRGKKLIVGLQLGRYTQFAVDPYFSTNVVARFTNHWKKLVDEGIVDAFILGDYEIVSTPAHVYWQSKKDIQLQDGEDLFSWAAREYQAYCKGKTRLYLFSEWLPFTPSQLKSRVHFWADVTRKNGFDGIDVHEAWNFESNPANMALLGAMVERLSIRVAGHPTRSADRLVPYRDEPPTKLWYRQEPLGEIPKRVTDAYPLSDQQNKGHWVRFEPMSDEFEGKELDRNKWTLGMEWWKGRPPALFSDKNITVSDGKLQLTTRKENLPPEVASLGYHDYTSAAVHTKVRSACGYYEMKVKAMNSAAGSRCFFQQDETPGWGTEIDLFEMGANAKQWERTVSFTVHIYRSPTKSYRTGPEEGQNWHSQYLWKAPWRPADDYHVYGLDWGEKVIGFYVDGVLIRSVENTHWHQPQYLILDSEVYPHWFGIPEDKDLPSTFNIEYVRAWKKAGAQ